MAAIEEQAQEKPKKTGLVMTGLAFVLLSVLGGGGGWLFGGVIAPLAVPPAADEPQPAEPPSGAHGAAAGEAEPAGRPNLFPLDPITTNLSYPSDNWIRIEVALLFRDAVDETLADRISEDILAYLRTVSLQQIEGPRGFQYLREDLVERARLRSEGKVTDIVFRTFVIE